MGLSWDWTDKMGTCTYDNGWESTLYRGNAFCIAINHLPDEMYNLAWFAVDEMHFKNLLGLTKGYDGCFKDFHITKLKLNTKYRETAKMVTHLAKAKAEVTIELYNE